MIIADTREGIEEFLNNLSKDKISIDFPIMGYLHEGHHRIINKIKENADIMIVNYQEHLIKLMQVLSGDERPLPNNYSNIISTAEINPNIDCLILNKCSIFPEHIAMINEAIKFFPKMNAFCKRRNICKQIAIESMFPVMSDLLDGKVTATKTGSKYFIQALLFQKVFGNNDCLYFKNQFSGPTLEFMKDENDVVYGRYNSSQRLYEPRKKIIEAINNNILNNNSIIRLLNEYFIPGRKFTIIDNKYLDRLNEINNDCTIILSDNIGYELIYIINGRLIY